MKRRLPALCMALLVSLTAMATPIAANSTLTLLTGPWKFHTGDNNRWADPGLDDSGWESVDLTAPEGAHDGDVGLTGYVPGWTQRGHARYHGYAWYRLRLVLPPTSANAYWLTGPPAIDDAYQLFVDGKYLGENGRFNKATPVVYSIQPRLFKLLLPKAASPGAPRVVVLAFRVWMHEGSLKGGEDAGGIHIAPALGDSTNILKHYHAQWRQTILGYVADAIEPFIFVLLAMLLYLFTPRLKRYQWLAAAMLLTALVRVNQVTYNWGQFESIEVYDLSRNFLLVPLQLAAWTTSWQLWLYPNASNKQFATGMAILTLIYMTAQLLQLQYVSPAPAGISKTAGTIAVGCRMLFALVIVSIVYKGFRHRLPGRWQLLPVILLMTTGLFANELSAIGIPGIWFPFGVGVSRTQYAYAALLIYLCLLLPYLLKDFRKYVTAVL